MPTTVLYRKSSGEVIKISPRGQTFADRNQVYWGVLQDPPMPDGVECRGPGRGLRMLGYAKIVDGSNVRNATEDEINDFIAYEDDDEKQQDADGAAELFESHPRFRKMMVAFAAVIMAEINLIRAELGLPPRKLNQLRIAIKNRIDKND